MERKKAYERLELPEGADLQEVRRKFAEIYNDYQMRIDNPPTPRMRQIYERHLEAVKEAYALLNGSDGMDDTADLPRTGQYSGSGQRTWRPPAVESTTQARGQQEAPTGTPAAEQRHVPPAAPKTSQPPIAWYILGAVVICAAVGFLWVDRRAASRAHQETAPTWDGVVPAHDWVYVKAEIFDMGSKQGEPDEKPVHRVSMTDFAVSKYPVTVGDYQAFCRATGRDMPVDEQQLSLPVTHVTWADAMAYCQWLGEHSAGTYRLPTEAEWEYVARGGNRRKSHRFSGGDRLSAVGWYKDNSGGNVHPVGKKAPNELDVYDLSGNIWEWCYDWYDEAYYERSPSQRNVYSKNPSGPAEGTHRVIRGGAANAASRACSVTNREKEQPDKRDPFIGFRIVKVP